MNLSSLQGTNPGKLLEGISFVGWIEWDNNPELDLSKPGGVPISKK
jgi:hypothetical protein